MKKKFLYLCLIVFSCSSLAACNDDDDSSSSSASSSFGAAFAAIFGAGPNGDSSSVSSGDAGSTSLTSDPIPVP